MKPSVPYDVITDAAKTTFAEHFSPRQESRWKAAFRDVLRVGAIACKVRDSRDARRLLAAIESRPDPEPLRTMFHAVRPELFEYRLA